MKQVNGKVLGVLLVLLCFTSASAQDNKEKSKKRGYQHLSDIITQYDKAKDETKVELKRMAVRPVMEPRAHVLYMTAYYIYPGKTPSKPKEVVIGFVSNSNNRDRKFQESSDLTANLDGKEIKFGPFELIDARSMPGFFKEVLGFFAPFDDFFHLVDNNKDALSMSLGKVRFDLTRDNLEALRDLASRIEPR